MERYNYEDLKEKAFKEPTAENLFALGEWLEMYEQFWNGEYYAVDDKRLFPIYREELDENGDLIQADIVGYEFR